MMKKSLILPSLLLAGIATPVLAQDAQPASPPAAQPADPNAGVPTGEVPPAASSMVPADPNAPKDPSAPVGSAANPMVAGGNMTAPPAEAHKEYPLCSKTVKDECINPSQAPGHKSHKKKKG
jgi:hypothetical protein